MLVSFLKYALGTRMGLETSTESCCHSSATGFNQGVVSVALFHRRRSPSPYYSRGGYRSRSRSRSYSPRK